MSEHKNDSGSSEKHNEKNKGGRPTAYTDELAEEICYLMASGMSLNKIVKLEHMPSGPTVYSWIGKYPTFLKKYEKAQQDRVEKHVEDLLDAATEPAPHEFRTLNDPSGVAYRKLLIDTMKWAISKLKPKKYGDKVDVDATTVATISTIVRKIVEPPKNDEEGSKEVNK